MKELLPENLQKLIEQSKSIDELLDKLQHLFSREMMAKSHEWNRALPFADYIVNRWEKAKNLGFSEGASIYDSSLVLGEVLVGRNTWVGPFTVLDGTGRLEIGDFCSISAGVQIYTHDTVKWALSGGVESIEHASVSIGNCCYIGPNVVISKGVTIGNGCIVGANSFVNKDIADGKKAWGNPAICQGDNLNSGRD